MNIFKSILSIVSAVSPVHIWFVTATSGAKKIGTDQFGNIYFEASPRKGYTRPRRWVLYKGDAEATKIPPEWHGWIHFQTNIVPLAGQDSHRREWQTPHQENQTGTNNAYKPNAGGRSKATGDYEAWSPQESPPQ